MSATSWSPAKAGSGTGTTVTLSSVLVRSKLNKRFQQTGVDQIGTIRHEIERCY